MPYIPIINNSPGIVGLLDTYTDTGKVLRNLADVLLNKNSDAFSKVERETVASYVSFLNNCNFCYKSHSAIADYLWSSKGQTKKIFNEIENENFSPKNKIEILLYISKKLQACPQGLIQKDINLLISFNFTPNDINDLILIISSFCMFNRYVDGLGTFNLAEVQNSSGTFNLAEEQSSSDTVHSLNDDMFNIMAEKIANNGYI